MSGIKQAKAKKIGLVSAISMLIGSTIGVGIFFKNNNVFEINDNNAIAVLIAWIISGLVSICAAFSFAEVGSCKQSHSGLGGWYEEMVGIKAGKFVKIIQPLFYFMVICFSISIFASESIFNIFRFSEKINFGLIMFIGLILFICFLLFNYFSLNISSKFQIVATGLKFVPLLMVIFGGIIYGSMNLENNLFNPNITKPSSINFVGIIISIPSILFAFDSFVGVGNLSLDMKNPKKNVPLAIIIGMVLVTLFYILVTVAQIFVGKGDIYQMFELILGSNAVAKNIVHIILSIFILVSIIGVLNAFSLILIRSCQSIVEENLVIGVRTIKRISNSIFGYNKELSHGTVLAFIFYLSLFIILLIPSSILNTDSLVDGISNFPTTIFFSFYATIILAALINRYTKKVSVIKISGFIPMAIIAIIGCYFVSGFQVFYTFLAQTIINPFEKLTWGLFSRNGFVTESWLGTLMMFLYLFLGLSYFLITNKLTNGPRVFKYFSYRKEAYD